MKEDIIYHTFKTEGRTVTLYVLVEKGAFDNRSIRVGYSICMSSDDYREDLAKTISLGRARHNKAHLFYGFTSNSTLSELIDSYSFQKSIAYFWESKLKKEGLSKYIKGVRPQKKKDD